MFTVYVIKSKSTGKIYIGSTKDYERRLKSHNQQLCPNSKSYTYKNKGPWELVYKEEYFCKKEALVREKYLKSHVGRDYLKLIIGPVAQR